MKFLQMLFTWWNGNTVGTMFYTWRKGKFVDRDSAGNRYYQTRDGLRRWVIYADDSEASNIPSQWYGWLHRLTDELPDDKPLLSWEKPRLANMTGTARAYHRCSSIALKEPSLDEAGYYQPWQPDRHPDK